MKSLSLTLALLCLLFFQCDASGPKDTEHSADSVKLVFIAPPNQGSFGKISLLGPSFLAFIGPDLLPVHIEKNEIPDTLTLPTRNGYLEISHQYKAYQFFYFYLKGGDVVTFRYNDLNQPVAGSALSEHQTEQYNFMQTIDGGSLDYGFSPRTLMSGLFQQSQERSVQLYEDYTRYMGNFERRLNDAIERQTLDSIYIGYYTKRYLREKTVFSTCGENLIDRKHSDIRKQEWDDDDAGYISYANSLHFAPDLDAILANTSMPLDTKNIIIYKYLRVHNLPGPTKKSQAVLNECYEKVIANTGDSTVVKRIVSEFEYQVKPPENIKTGDMILIARDGKSVTLESVLTKHKGKVVYIDFWASWCPPCIGNFPAAEVLKKEYLGEEVVFLYLAFKDSKDGWEKAVNEYGLNKTNSESYFIANEDESDLIKKLKIQRIPRYIIVNKEGELTNADAPRPSGKEIRNVLNDLLRP